FIVARSVVSGGPYTDIATLPANTMSYSCTNLLAGTTYYFVIRASNTMGTSSNSSEANATTFSDVPTPPIITAQPQSQTVIVGNNAVFSVSATATPAPAYQWRFNSTNIAGATNNSFIRGNVMTSDSGDYSVIVSNPLGSTNSVTATLSVNVSLTVNTTTGGSIAKNPDQSNYPPNSTVTLSATPNANFIFTGWTGDLNSTNNPINITLTTNKFVTANFVSTLTEIILDNPSPDVTFVGNWSTGTSSGDKYAADYRFANSFAGGTSNVSYRPRIGVAGYYDVYIWYPQGSNRSPNAPWTVFYNGGSTNISVNQQINGGQWFLIAAARPFLSGTNGYVRLSNDASGNVVLADAVRFVYVGAIAVPPAITTQPFNQTARVGTNVTFSVTTTGSVPLSYQWRFNNNNISAATNNTYTRLNVQTNDTGAYSVMITNSIGGVISSNAVLTVTLPGPTQFQSIIHLLDGRMDLIFSGDLGVSYWIDRTTNLVDWEPLTNMININGLIEFIDTSATNSDKGFYRVRE
ncbi:MAG: immunoglobulin domain-containing protein, partial [Verrucomicrobiota bacterium]|nr:immunoglobulin domain-containing protein [Verrucomicrobiota bacterium]